MLRLILSVVVLMVCTSTAMAQKKFTIVIDAGHGGHDAGAIGDFSREKDICLKVALAFGKMLEEKSKDVRVLYTRKTDVFIPLYQRPQVANKAKADLFVSIHVNSVEKGSPRTARGVETYTNGIAQSKANMAVAQRENSVILLESDYKEHYDGFNPNEPESYVMWEFMQNQYMAKSVELARCFQLQLRQSGGRQDRGVKQTSLAVLRGATMPSVLVEVGFISTPQEEQFLNTPQGIQTTALCLYNGVVDYRNKHDRRSNKLSTEPVPKPVASEPAATPEAKPAAKEAAPAVQPEPQPAKETAQSEPKPATPNFRIQFLTSPHKLADNDARLSGLDHVSFYRDGQLYKYTSGTYATRAEANKKIGEVRQRYPDAFIVKFMGDERATQ
ncbi:MAG: N-acetylmuramoyl-L-alanine amidase [Alloprevotella sp.]|nr:N-acetylmuramoyl-L-alanine amidase [Alloprevotella sp.]